MRSPHFGGTGQDTCKSAAIDAAGNVSICGSTVSGDFLVVGAVQPGLGGSTDAFVVKLAPTSPAAPSGLTAVLNGSGGIRLSWFDSAGDETWVVRRLRIVVED